LIPGFGRRLRAAVLLVLSAGTLLMGGCGTSGRTIPGADPFAGGAAAAEVRLRVRNNNFYDATLWALNDSGSRRRLGTVSGNQSAVFTMPWPYAATLRVQIDLLAGSTCTTDPISVNPGDDLELQIQSTATSNFCR
jgi:hypothetical protein